MVSQLRDGCDVVGADSRLVREPKCCLGESGVVGADSLCVRVIVRKREICCRRFRSIGRPEDVVGAGICGQSACQGAEVLFCCGLSLVGDRQAKAGVVE